MTQNRSKIVAIVQTQAENAGAQEVARRLAQGMERRGWRARQVFFFRRTDAFDEDPNAVFLAPARPERLLDFLKLLRALHAEFRRAPPDAVVLFQHYGNVVGAPLARLAGAPIVIANQVTAPPLIPRAVVIADKIIGALGLYDHIVVNSARMEADYRSYPASYAKRLARVDHGFFDKSAPLSKAEARARLGLPQDATLLGCAARLHKSKQIDLAIRLLAINHDHSLALAGQGPERASLAALAQSLGVLPRVHFLGELDTAGMGAFFAALDCFVFPSAMESFGLAPVEAAQAGLPVIANDIAALREALAVGDTPCAIFVQSADIAAFADAARRILADPVLRESLTSAGKRLSARYPLEAMIDAYVRLIEQVRP